MRSEDSDLIRRYLAGDRAAIDEVDAWIGRAAWSFRRRLGNHWEDALQDVRLEVTRLLTGGRFRGESSLKTYVWRVASNACVDRARSQSRVQWSEIDELDQAGGPAAEVAADRSQAREERDLAVRVLARMSGECRQLWSLLFEGFSYQQMSERLGVSEGALRVRVLRCRRRALEVRNELLTHRIDANGNNGGGPAPNLAGR